MAKFNFKDFDDNELLLVITPSRFMQKTNLEILKYYLNKRNLMCVYVTVTKPYKTIINILTKNKIKTDKIFFIDCITPFPISHSLQKLDNCVFCEPQSLTHISIALGAAIENLPKDHKKVLILDSMSTLMLYNEARIVSRFMHSLTGKLRAWEAKSIIFTLEEETDPNIISQISQFCDISINISE